MEIQILDNDAPRYRKLRAAQYHGSIYDVIPAKTGFLKPTGQWNEEEITARGHQITVKLNGHTIVDATWIPSPMPQFSKTLWLARTTGHVGFLGHGPARVWFRNVRIQELR
jgi:hypothetical protein